MCPLTGRLVEHVTISQFYFLVSFTVVTLIICIFQICVIHCNTNMLGVSYTQSFATYAGVLNLFIVRTNAIC